MPKFQLKTLFIGISIVALLLALICSAFFKVQEATHRNSCFMNVKQIGLSILKYESANLQLPIGIKTDATGSPYRSWRTRVCFFMESSRCYYDSDFAWDAPKNKRLIDGTPIAQSDKFGGKRHLAPLDPCRWFTQCPSCARRVKKINYAVVVGEETAFPLNRAVRLDEITDGLENTILVVETLSGSSFWTEPKDLQFDSMSFCIDRFSNEGLSSYHPNGAYVCFADGGVHFVTKAISPDELRALLTIAGGESVTRQDLIDRGVIR